MSEEEKIEWAKTHTWKPRTRLKDNTLVTAKKTRAKQQIKERLKRRKEYANPEIRARKFGDDYNARIRYLYQHNAEFRELKRYRVAIRSFRLRRPQYEAWTDKYYKQYKGRMQDKASIFKLEGTENYVYGFTLKDLIPYSPVGKIILARFISELILPPPKYSGYKWKNNKALNKNVEQFYLVSEIEEFLNVFAKYRKKFTDVSTEQQKLFIKKQLWKLMLNARKNFDNE